MNISRLSTGLPCSASLRFGKLSKPIPDTTPEPLKQILEESLELYALPAPGRSITGEIIEDQKAFARYQPLWNYFRVLERALSRMKAELGVTLNATGNLLDSRRNFPPGEAFQLFTETLARFMAALECRMKKAPRSEIQRFCNLLKSCPKHDYTPIVSRAQYSIRALLPRFESTKNRFLQAVPKRKRSGNKSG